MKLKYLLLAMLLMFILGIAACGSDADGLNGAIDVEAEVTGTVVTATATYDHPTETDLIGVPVDFSYRIGNVTTNLGTVYTNNSGSVGVAFSPVPFSGTQTITIIARTGELTDFDTIEVVGSSLTLDPPDSLSLTTSEAAGSTVTVSIPETANFITITDPFSTDLAHPVTISASFVSGSPADTVIDPADTTANSSGIAVFPGTTATMTVPALGGANVMTITWTVENTVTGQIGTATTTITLRKTS